jgi:hypothetical protein
MPGMYEWLSKNPSVRPHVHIMRGGSITLKSAVGHANIAITLDTYSHVIPGMGDTTARAMEDALEGDQQEVHDTQDA